MMLVTAAFTGNTVGQFLATLCEVYVALILIYILISVALNFGLRPSYSRAFDVFMGFLRDVCEPYLGVFRRFIQPLGGIDLSPIFAIIILGIVEQILVNVFNS